MMRQNTRRVTSHQRMRAASCALFAAVAPSSCAPGGESQRLRGLPQSQIAGNEEHYHHKTNNVDNIVHVSSSFFHVIGLLSSELKIYPHL
jgi:hypothetical protein